MNLLFIEGLYWKRPIQCLAYSKIVNPHPLHCLASVYPPCHWCGVVANELCSKKIPRNKLGTVFVIPREKMHISRNSMWLGITERNEIPRKNEVWRNSQHNYKKLFIDQTSYRCKRHRKRRTKNNVYMSPLSFVPVPQSRQSARFFFFSSPLNWDPPPPHPQASVSPLLFRERGWGIPIGTMG